MAQIPIVINMSQEGNLEQGMKRLYNAARDHVMLNHIKSRKRCIC